MVPATHSDRRTALEARELGGVSIALLVFILACLALARGFPLFTQSAWLDEYHTLFVAGAGTLREGMQALARGADFSPPALHIFVRSIGEVAGGVDTSGRELTTLRGSMFGLVYLAVLGVYVLLRRKFEVTPSFLGATSLWVQPLVVRHAFELRFYGAWLLFSVLFILALSREVRRHSLVASVAIGASAIALCLIHYFGIFTWALILAANVASRGPGRFRSRFRGAIPAALGPLALLACAPFYFGQKEALTVTTWVSPVSAASLGLFFSLLTGATALLAAFLFLAPRLRLLPRPTDPQAGDRVRMTQDPAIASLLALGVLPFVLVAFSLVVQPALITRYAIASVLVWPPLIALGTTTIHHRLRPSLVLVIMSLVTFSVSLITESAKTSEAARARLWRDLTDVGRPGELVVVNDRKDLYPLARASGLATQLTFVYPEVLDMVHDASSDMLLVERDVARVHASILGFPTLRSIPELRTLSEFLLVDAEDSEEYARRWFPQHSSERVAPRLFRLRRPTHRDVGSSS